MYSFYLLSDYLRKNSDIKNQEKIIESFKSHNEINIHII